MSYNIVFEYLHFYKMQSCLKKNKQKNYYKIQITNFNTSTEIRIINKKKINSANLILPNLWRVSLGDKRQDIRLRFCIY